MELIYATSNKGKVNSLKRELEPLVKVIQEDLGLLEPRSDDVEYIAKVKVIQAFEELEKPVVANDAALYIHSLKGYPGTLVSLTLEKIEIEGILRLVAHKNRECAIMECISYLDRKLKEPRCFISADKGKIAYEPRGETQGKNYLKSKKLAQIFVPEGIEKTLAEMDSREYEEWHKKHRKKHPSASKLFTEWYLDYKKIK